MILILFSCFFFCFSFTEMDFILLYHGQRKLSLQRGTRYLVSQRYCLKNVAKKRVGSRGELIQNSFTTKRYIRGFQRYTRRHL